MADLNRSAEMKGKRYRVYYAGAANEGLVLAASSWKEAAFLFFSNRPERRTVFVGRTALFEREVRYDDLRTFYPEADGLLAKLGGQRDVIDQTLRTDFAMTKLWDEEEAKEAAKVKSLKVRAIATGVTLFAYVAYRFFER